MWRRRLRTHAAVNRRLEIVSDDGERKALAYDSFIPVAIRAIQEQQGEIEEQAARLGEQQEQLTEQAERIENLETLLLELIEERKQQ